MYTICKFNIYKPIVMYSAIFSHVLKFLERILKFQKKVITLYILLMHLIEYYFNVNWNLVYNISNNAIYDQ